MNHFSRVLLPFILLLASPLIGEEKTTTDIAKLSEAMGHLIGKNLQSSGIPIDIEALVQGMKNGCKGTESILSEEECIQALTALQEKAHAIESEKNLSEANDFLKQNSQNKDIVSIENGKIHYQVVKPGSGNAVQSYSAPLLRYQGHYLNGQTFGSSSGDEVLALDETIDGFRKGVVGMHEGEVRTLYIHPDLGYGPDSMSMPNALLVFEVELIKADVSAEAQAAGEKDPLPIAR